MTTITPERQAFLEAERAKWLTPMEASQVLGVSRNKITDLLRHGLRHRREGKMIRIHIDDLRPNQGGHDDQAQ